MFIMNFERFELNTSMPKHNLLNVPHLLCNMEQTITNNNKCRTAFKNINSLGNFLIRKSR